MAIFITNDDVRKLLPMDECVAVLEDMFQQEAAGLVENLARRRFRVAGTSAPPGPPANLMGGVVAGSHAYGTRHNSVTLLHNTDTNKLEAVLEPGAIATIRTGAATGVAVKYMSRPDASIAGVIGTGRLSGIQIDAIRAVRNLKLIKVYSRNEEKRRQFAEATSKRLGIEVVATSTAEEAVKGSHIVVAMTTSREPVFDGTAIDPGTHVSAVGANSWTKREIDETTIQRANLIAVDNLEQAQIECGELIWAVERGLANWRRVVELHQVVGGQIAGWPSDDAITLFESQGIGIEDVAASAYVLEKARAAGIGMELPF
jgi:ornithine cyclodeaminase/alanine dehydrogenase-like protein (mu-crystallin family)